MPTICLLALFVGLDRQAKGTVHSHANPYWTTELYGKAILGLKESDVCFSAAKLFFAYDSATR